jgi:outer membrane protein assembly factor BamB
MARRVRMLGLVVGLVIALAGCDWPMFRFDAGHTGFNQSEILLDKSNVGSLHPIWLGMTGALVESSPAVANGVVYIGSEDHKLYAFDAAGTTGCSGTPKTCAPLWTGATGERISSSPAVANGVVYVGSFDGKLYAFDATGRTGCSHAPKTCAPLWTSDTTGNIQLSSPAVANGIVYLNSYVMGSGRTFAFDAAGSTGCSGSPKTCTPLVTLFTNDFGISSPTVVNGHVYVASGTALLVFAP